MLWVHAALKQCLRVAGYQPRIAFIVEIHPSPLRQHQHLIVKANSQLHDVRPHCSALLQLCAHPRQHPFAIKVDYFSLIRLAGMDIHDGCAAVE